MEKEIILVIGGSNGIGEAIVNRLAGKSRIIVFTWHRSKTKSETILKQIKKKGYEIFSYKLDVSDSASVNQFVDTVGNCYKKIDILINNAGIIRDNPMYLIDDDDWHNVINTNLSGVFFMCRAVSKYMIRQRKGKIVNISSINAKTGSRGQVNYNASKGGIEALTRSLAVELAKKNIIVNCIAPGIIETRMTKHLIKEYGEIIKAGILLRRIGKPEEVANVVSFLAGNESSYINGQIIRVDGGML